MTGPGPVTSTGRGKIDMEELEDICLALFDLAQERNNFKRLEERQKFLEKVREEKDRLKKSVDEVQAGMVEMDERRAYFSKLANAVFPREARETVKAEFDRRFNAYFQEVQNALEKQVSDCHELQVKTVVALAQAQQLELDEISTLKGK